MRGVLILITFSSAMYFSDGGMKTEDYSFRGFPGCWNMVVIVFFGLSPRLDHPECHNGFGDCDVSDQIHPSNAQNAGAWSRCRWGRFGQSVQDGLHGCHLTRKVGHIMALWSHQFTFCWQVLHNNLFPPHPNAAHLRKECEQIGMMPVLRY